MKSMRYAYTVRLKLQLCIIFIPYQVVLANSETSLLMMNIKNTLCRFFLFCYLSVERAVHIFCLVLVEQFIGIGRLITERLHMILKCLIAVVCYCWAISNRRQWAVVFVIIWRDSDPLTVKASRSSSAIEFTEAAPSIRIR